MRSSNMYKLVVFTLGLVALGSVASAQSATASSTYAKSVVAAAQQGGTPLPLVPASMVSPGHMRPFVWVSGKLLPLATPATIAGSSAPSFCNPSQSPILCWNELQTAYGTNFPSANGGAGITIAVVDAYYYANAYNDLAVYSSFMGLPPCPPVTCFNQVTFGTTPPGNTTWDVETMLDLEAVHSIAPNAKILLVEAVDQSIDSLVGTALAYAVAHADIVSNSYGYGESPDETSMDVPYAKPVLFSSGDHGAPLWPCVSPYVTCVGGTTLTVNTAFRRTSETAWSCSGTNCQNGGSGGGCSQYESAVAYQNGFVPSTFAPCVAARAVPDVAADANPGTGLWIYDSYSFPGEVVAVGGTSLASPLTAAMYADVMSAYVAFGKPKFGPMNSELYSAATRTPGPPKIDSYFFFDVTSGSNVGYSAGPGYDVVTGLGASIPIGMGNRFFGLVDP